MSDIGTYKTLCEQIKPYAELIDKALVAMKTNQKDSPTLEEFEQLLERILTDKTHNASERVLKLILKSKNINNLNLLSDIKAHFRDTDNIETVVTKTEQIAKMLEEEQNEAFAKIGSWSR
ncbi:hypothetical protein JW887_05465 [Candidatus Dojkabacteria bacterium]|nr:hypothetical protein [Candidatus Dojkabacteria bacterium]